MRILELYAIPKYESAVIPKDGYAIRETCNVVKLDDLIAIKDRKCSNCYLHDEIGKHDKCKCRYHKCEVPNIAACPVWCE